jgi:SsrA-binding protein
MRALALRPEGAIWGQAARTLDFPMAKELIRVIARNKRAKYDYELGDRFEAGLELRGSEVKALRAGKASILESYVRLRKGEAFLLQANIPELQQASYNNHEPTRPRKLLLNKSELKKLKRLTTEKNLTMVPMTLFFKGAWVKLEFATGKGKKQHDKRETLKKKTAQYEQRNHR